MPWLLAIGQKLRIELDDVEQPVSERLAALLKELDGPPFATGRFAPDPSTAEAGTGI